METHVGRDETKPRIIGKENLPTYSKLMKNSVFYFKIYFLDQGDSSINKGTCHTRLVT